MDALKLSEGEQKLYEEIFQSWDVDKVAKITKLRALDLFKTAGLSADALSRVLDLCGASRLGYLGRSQFYIALKLIAACQAGLPVSLDSFSVGADIRLPIFRVEAQPLPQAVPTVVTERSSIGGFPPPPQKTHGRHGSGSATVQSFYPGVVGPSIAAPGHHVSVGVTQSVPLLPGTHQQQQPHLSMSAGLHQAPAVAHQANSVAGVRLPDPSLHQDASHYSQVPPTHHQVPPTHHQAPPTHHQAPPTHHQSPPTHHQVPPTHHQSPPTHHQVPPSHQVPHAHHQIPPTHHQMPPGHHQVAHQRPVNEQPQADWANFETTKDKVEQLSPMCGQEGSSLRFDSWSESSEYATSEADSQEDIWSINDQQREYYLTQFITMQADLSGVINGAVAKEFFEKSKLATRDLSRIWQLSDCNKDGALSLEEFCTAMHLVVLKRNGYDLPSHLPLSLMPYASGHHHQTEEPFSADLPPGSTIKRVSPLSPSQPTPSFSEAPSAGESSGLSSPSNRPINFDTAPSNDPDIVHPVAVKVAPAEKLPALDGGKPGRTGSAELTSSYDAKDMTDAFMPSNRPPLDSIGSSDLDTGYVPSKLIGPIQGRPRPTPTKRTQSVPGESRALIQPPPQPVVSQPTQVYSAGLPLIPPRQKVVPPIEVDQSHALPDSHVTAPAGGDIVVDAPNAAFANFDDFNENIYQANASERSGDLDDPSEVFPLQTFPQTVGESTQISIEDMVPPSAPENSDPSPRLLEDLGTVTILSTREKRELERSIRQQKERNYILTRMNEELNAELQEVMEQRIALEIQLEHLKRQY